MKRTRQRAVALIVCLGGFAGVVPAASAAAASRLIDCGISTFGGKVAPALWSAGCTGGSFIVSEMKWPSGRWGARSVTATGTRLRNTCDPSCAEGKYIRHPGKLTISAIKACASPLGYVRFYTRVAWIPADGSGRFSYRQRCVPASFRISLKGPGAQFGPFDEASDWKTVPDLTILFGPARKVRADAATCVLSWRKTGVVATFVKYGTLTGDPCKVGYFRSANLVGRRWHTGRGVHPGGAASTARRWSLRRCTTTTCGVNGYVLKLSRSDCAAGVWPTVIAVTAKGRVRRILVRSQRCE